MCPTIFAPSLNFFNDVPFNVPFKVGFRGTSAELFNLSIYSRFTLRIDRNVQASCGYRVYCGHIGDGESGPAGVGGEGRGESGPAGVGGEGRVCR